jgi:hypothetical protein
MLSGVALFFLQGYQRYPILLPASVADEVPTLLPHRTQQGQVRVLAHHFVSFVSVAWSLV